MGFPDLQDTSHTLHRSKEFVSRPWGWALKCQLWSLRNEVSAGGDFGWISCESPDVLRSAESRRHGDTVSVRHGVRACFVGGDLRIPLTSDHSGAAEVATSKVLRRWCFLCGWWFSAPCLSSLYDSLRPSSRTVHTHTPKAARRACSSFTAAKMWASQVSGYAHQTPPPKQRPDLINR